MGKPEPSTLRIGRRYRANRLAGPYDAIVIGSGIGGLTCAALLSAMGRRVCVLEQHYTAGGYTHSYERKGYEWDVGLHYVGDVGHGTMLRRLFDFLSDGRLQWAPMDKEFDRFHIGDQVYSAIAGREAFRESLVRRFPGEVAAIDRYFALLDGVNRAMPLHTAGLALRPWAQRLVSPLLDRLRPDYLTRSSWDVLTELTDNTELLTVLCAQWGDTGLPPKRSAFLIQALVAHHYLAGGYYPVGGSWRIADTILPRIRAAGGEVFTYAPVQKILVERGVTRGVEMADGTRIDCNCVVSSAGVFNTFERLLPAEAVQKAGYDRLLPRVKRSSAHLGVYVGLKGTAAELGLPRTNIWIYPGRDYEQAIDAHQADYRAPFPVVYLSFPSAKDPDYERRHPGTATIEIVAPTHYEWFARWADTEWGRRGPEYEAFKAQFGERLMAHLYDKMPQLKGRVDYMEVSTPLSTRYFGGWQQGELYGLDHDPARFGEKWLTPRTRIPGLWLTGQDVLACGVAGATMSGVLSATAIAGLRRTGPLMKKIFID